MKKEMKYVVVFGTGKSCMVDNKTEADVAIAEARATDAGIEITLFKQIGSGGAKTGTRIKRSNTSLSEIKSKILLNLSGLPISAAALAVTLGVTPKELVLPMRQLVASKEVAAEGKCRGVKYTSVAKV